MMTDREKVFDAITNERAYQDRKWGVPHPLDVGAWLTVLRVELAEAELAWAKAPGEPQALREVLQVAAVAVACLEHHGVFER